MQPTTRTALGVASGVAAALMLVSGLSKGWYYTANELARYLPEAGDRSWYGFGGPHYTFTGAWFPAAAAVLCGAAVAFGTLVGRRRDHVPRLPALFAAALAVIAVGFQAFVLTTWRYYELPKPHGFGWAMPLFFLGGIALAVVSLILWTDARRRARKNTAALAAIDRELTGEEPPLPRL